MEQNGNDENGVNNLIGLGILGGIMILIILWNVYIKNDEKEIKGNYGITEGWIRYYDDGEKSVERRARSIEYSYQVNSKVYSRRINTDLKFRECNDGVIGKCASKRFWVIYSKKAPNRSLIDLNIEIQKSEELEFPKQINGFM
jgi:hypothetical protein